MHTIGIDIGGTTMGGARVDEWGTIVGRAEARTPDGGLPDVIREVVRICRELTADHLVTAVGVGVAGMVDERGRLVELAPNLGWRAVPLEALLREQLLCPVVILNDANAAGWAEFSVGAGQGCADALLVTVGTGVGGALLVGGKLIVGARGGAGEIGHLRVVPGGAACSCGARGCLEQYASGTAVARRAAAHPELAGLSFAALEQRLATGDPVVRKLIAEAGGWLGEACASMGALTDPECIIVGGGLSRAGEALLGPMRVAYERTRPAASERPAARIVPAQWGNDAGMLGAALYARGGTDAQYSGETL